MNIEWHDINEPFVEKEGFLTSSFLVKAIVGSKEKLAVHEGNNPAFIQTLWPSQHFLSWSYIKDEVVKAKSIPSDNPYVLHFEPWNIPDGFYLVYSSKSFLDTFELEYVKDNKVVDIKQDKCLPLSWYTQVIPLENFDAKDYPYYDLDYEGFYNVWTQRNIDAREKDYTSQIEMTYPKNEDVEVLKPGDLVVFLSDDHDFPVGTRAIVMDKSSNNDYSLCVENSGHTAWFHRDELRLVASPCWKDFKRAW